jgi:FAD/FMN-containing dehydrogenase
VTVAFQQRKRWRNHTGNQSIEPLRIYRPATLDDLREIVQSAERDGTTVRAVGSGHSWSDVALTAGYLLRPERLNAPLEITGNLVRVEAGMRLRELNRHLDDNGLALSNMGGYDAQTVAGVMSTSTHGSGIGFGPIADSVRSIDLVASGGRVIRVEREDGPSTHFDGELRKDDDVFNAVAVGMGCLGVIYAAAIAVEPEYWLTEVRELSTWSRERARIPDALAVNRHYEVYLNLYPGEDGEHRCIACRRNRATDHRRKRASDRLRRHLWLELASRSKVIPFLGNLVLDALPDTSPKRTDQLLGFLADNEYTGPSYKVLNIGAANLLPAYSSELAVPLDRYAEAIERLIEVAARHRDLGRVYHTGLVALRFVQASPAYLSMMHGRDTMMIELIQATDTEGGFELLGAYEEALYDIGGRPHWGQVNTLAGPLGRMYPEYDRWLAVHEDLNATGVFDSPFSKRVGISR